LVTLEQIRTIALNLPAVTETLHLRLPTFEIGGRGFITVQKAAAIMALPEDLSMALSDNEPEKFKKEIKRICYPIIYSLFYIFSFSLKNNF
jgi:hypothetical protein